MASTPLTKEFLQVIQHRRTVYDLSKKEIMNSQDLVQYIRELVRETPSSFNVQSGRVVVLIGDQHDKYWKEIVPKAVTEMLGENVLGSMQEKLNNFARAFGTVLFFEDERLIKGQQETYPSYAASFPTWSLHSTGMAQVYVWAGLEAAGYGANLQHYGNLTAEKVRKQYNLPQTYQLQSELVFGHPDSPAAEKTYNPDHERVIAYGHSS